MLAKVLLICLAVVSPLVCSSAVQKDDHVRNQYFSHVKDRRSALSPKIVGGQDVTPYSYPFQVLLLIYKGNNIYFCGGSLISNQWVLTAAQCVSMNPDYILVGLGQHDIINPPSTAVVMNATRAVAHRGYDPDTFQNDVGLVRLPHNVTFTDHIKTVSLASGTSQYEGAEATLLGWGQTETQSMSQVLKAAKSTILSNTVCASTSSDYQSIIKSTHLCTSGVGSVGICSGDGGGPLIANGIQVGITSFGTTNCLLGMPSVFTRVTEFHDWILENMKDGASGPDSLRVTAVLLIAFCFSYLFK